DGGQLFRAQVRQHDDRVRDAQAFGNRALLRSEVAARAYEARARELATHLREDLQQNVNALARDCAPDVQKLDGARVARAEQTFRLSVCRGVRAAREGRVDAVRDDGEAFGREEFVRDERVA